MSNPYRDKLLSVGVLSRRGSKVTVDDHGTHKVKVTEHWNDRQDVHVQAPTIRVRPKGTVADGRDYRS